MKVMYMNKNCLGSNFDDFLKEENLLQEADTVAIKRIIAYELEQKMIAEHITVSLLIETKMDLNLIFLQVV